MMTENMNKGLAIVEVNDTGTKSFYIDQDALECARLNARTKKRIDKAEQIRREDTQRRRKAERMAAKRREYNVRSICYILGRCAVSVAVAWATWGGLVHPVVSVPVITFCLCAACLRLGAWIGSNK